MQPYQRVVVLMSILMGLAVTQLLKGAAQLYRNRSRVAPYWLHTGWVMLLVCFSFLIAAYGVLAGLATVAVRGMSLLDSSHLFRLVMVLLALVLVRSAGERVHALGFAAFVALMVGFVLLFQFRLT